VQESLAYAIEIARGLTVAHARKMVHRDIKPQNVLIDAEGRAKLTDFGISRQLEKEGMTATGRVLGTTDYVAPEQAMGRGADQRSDIYSLGVVLFEMLTGHVPFQADSQVGVAMKHVNEELPDVQADRPGLSAATALVVERATAKDPTKRYADIGEMIDDLSTALEVEAARAGSTTGEATTVLEAVPPAKRKLSRRATWSWVAILAAIGIAAAVLLATQLIGSGNVGNGGHPSNNGNGGGGGKTSEHPVAIEGATDYDPEGDGEEDPETVGLAVDGNPTGTAWSSEHYDTDTFAGTKEGPNPGVGLYVTTQAAVTPDKMKIITPTPGWDAQIYAAASGPPEEVEEWGEAVGEVKDAAKEEEVDLHLGQAAKYFLIWFTKASPASDQEGRFQVEIADVKLFE
jgi:serine/threonine-protein kinase